MIDAPHSAPARATERPRELLPRSVTPRSREPPKTRSVSRKARHSWLAADARTRRERAPSTRLGHALASHAHPVQRVGARGGEEPRAASSVDSCTGGGELVPRGTYSAASALHASQYAGNWTAMWPTHSAMAAHAQHI